METFHEGNNSLVDLGNVAYYFSVKGSAYGESDSIVDTDSSISIPTPGSISGGYQIVNEGEDNTLPYQLRQLIDDNNLIEGVLDRQRGLQYGQGIALYEPRFEADGKRSVIWRWDDAIGKDLETWDYEEYLLNTLADLVWKREYATKFLGNRGMRIGKAGFLTGLKHTPIADVRRQWPDSKGNINNFFVADWRDGEPSVIERYKAFDQYKGIEAATTMYWHRMYQPGRALTDPTLPKYWGSRKWIQRSNIAPSILKAQTDNGLNIKWHIISPQSYWDKKRDILMKDCEAKGKKYNESMLEDLKDKILQGLSKVLSGIENTGKFFHSESVMQQLGVGSTELLKWELIPIDMKVKDFTEAQINISKRADSSISSGAGMPPSLANIVIDGKLASGSEKLYDYKLFIATETATFQAAALKAMNIYKRLKFPNVPGYFGFYHDVVKREEDLTSSARTTNNEN